jgi:NADH-quinone oxidoreductase subunit E
MMTQTMQKLLTQMLSTQGIEEINRWIDKYPDDQKQSAVMQSLMIAQQEHGHLTQELMDAIAEYLDMPAIAVYEVASFYSMYELKPVGEMCINVCTNVSCQLRGAKEIVNHLEQRLNIKVGQTTIDGKFSLRSVECLGACVNAPMMQVNKANHEDLTPEIIDQILKQYQ